MADSKTAFLSGYTDAPEERTHLSHMLDCMHAAAKRGMPCAGAFLTPRERRLAEQILKSLPAKEDVPAWGFWGGYEDAERTVLAFVPEWTTPGEFLGSDESPIACLRAVNREAALSGRAPLTHRDYLGALMAAGLRRDAVGDLLVNDGGCDLILLKTIVPYVRESLIRAGHSSLQLEEIAQDALCVPEQKFKEIRATAASLRLDAVAGEAFSVSRSRAADAIRAGAVSLDHLVCTKPDASVAEGAVLAWRGLGKAVLTEAGGLSKKGRVILKIRRFL